jgi:hypothetical protein
LDPFNTVPAELTEMLWFRITRILARNTGDLRVHDISVRSLTSVLKSTPARKQFQNRHGPAKAGHYGRFCNRLQTYCRPKQYNVPSYVPRYTRPFATVTPLKWFHWWI